MTPFGAKVRALRSARNVTLKEMAPEIGVSGAYLSALEHGHRGKPNWAFVQRVIAYFNVIWDEAEELERLAGLSNPRIAVDTAGLSPNATELANRLAMTIGGLGDDDIDTLLERLKTMSVDETGSRSKE